MKKLLSLLALFATFWTANAHAQTYDLRFVPEVRGNVLALHVQIRLQSGTSPLGTSNFVFTFDETVLSYPDPAAAGADYEFAAFDASTDANYEPATARLASEGTVSLNIVNMSDAGTDVGTTYMEVAEVLFDILDSDATPQFTWIAEQTVAYDAAAEVSEGVAVEWTQGTLEDASNVALPVELVSFTAKTSGAAVQLSWATASETNNAGFDVQYAAADSGRFVSAGFVDGRGTTSESQTYTFQFDPGQLGTYRVRLKQVDFDGSFSFSPEVEVSVSQLTTAEDGEAAAYVLSQATPNPFRHSSALSLQLVTGQQVRAVLYNALGQEVRTVLDAFIPSGSTQLLTVEGADLSPGMYVLQVEGEKFAETRQLVLVR